MSSTIKAPLPLREGTTPVRIPEQINQEHQLATIAVFPLLYRQPEDRHAN